MLSVPVEECILFLGAGVHAAPPAGSPYKYPEAERPLLGGDLAELLAKECGFCTNCPDESPRDLQRVSLCFETERLLNRKLLVDRLEACLQTGKKPSPALRMLAALPFKIIVTTNYDRLLETALREAGKEPMTFVYSPEPGRPAGDPNKDPSTERPLLFKMHGDLERRESIVITDEDYIRFIQRMSEKDREGPVPGTVLYRMTRWSTLFLGYSLRDYNLRLLFRTLRWRKDGADIQPSWSVDPRPDVLIKRVYEEGQKLISFVVEDLWEFVPSLYRQIHGKDYPV
jgi:SIR2-like domain